MTARNALLVSVAVVSSLLAAGCGCSASPGVAKIGSSAADASTTATTRAAKFAAFYGCMTGHGFANYRLPTLMKGTGSAATVKLSPAQVSESQSPGFAAAEKTCAPLLPGFGSWLDPAREAVARTRAREFSECVRRHGLPNFPDPDSSGAINLSAAGIDPESPGFLHAEQGCQRLAHGIPFLIKPPG